MFLLYKFIRLLHYIRFAGFKFDIVTLIIKHYLKASSSFQEN